ncbi:MAG: 1-deoxy-D-xylulose-5-phosphate reductoisomerase [Thermoguttaceae bacterium]|nr:1-deoxy-D-xylulose-5-phosphate reductoisomerase [Thermoguttaceae bacterium]MDO4425885.1 1-deoxy-D-xylulose-5-phosphate reductoisomerase [Planctomycetia bacterium]
MKNIALFGATGSIGRSTLDVVKTIDGFRVLAISGHKNLKLLHEQSMLFRPRWVILTDENAAKDWNFELPVGSELCVGMKALTQIAAESDVDIVVSAIVGRAGLESTIAAAQAGKRIALANKESLVAGGALVKQIASETGAEIIPVDSEHSAIFQSLQAGKRKELERVILTASGGPFFRLPEKDLKNVTLDQALKHPTWNMGAKVTLDSATLMNKALEIIEAKWLFDLDMTRRELEVMIHPQSIVHSMVEFHDGAVIAQMSPPDMRLPIQNALTYPERVSGGPTKRTNWSIDQTLEFFAPDYSKSKFDALKLGLETASLAGTAGVVLNAANEMAVTAFTRGELRFDEIVPRVRKTVEEHDFRQNPTLEELTALDEKIRKDFR